MKKIYILNQSLTCFSECPFGNERTLDASDSADDIIVDVLGELNDTDADARDALFGSNDTLWLCHGDVFFVKMLCPEEQEGFVLSLSFSVSGVDNVNVAFLNASSVEITMESVSLF